MQIVSNLWKFTIWGSLIVLIIVGIIRSSDHLLTKDAAEKLDQETITSNLSPTSPTERVITLTNQIKVETPLAETPATLNIPTENKQEVDKPDVTNESLDLSDEAHDDPNHSESTKIFGISTLNLTTITPTTDYQEAVYDVGSIRTVINNVATNNDFLIYDLKQIDKEGEYKWFAAKWSGEEAWYAFAKSLDVDLDGELTMQPLLIDGEGIQRADVKVSPLIPLPNESEGYKFLIIYSPNQQDGEKSENEFELDFISPSESPTHTERVSPSLDSTETSPNLSTDPIYNGSTITLQPAELSGTTGTTYNLKSGANYSSLNIQGRNVWGANTSNWDPNSSSDINDISRLVWLPYYYGVSRIVIHHTVTGVGSTDPSADIRGIYLYHTYSRGWGDVGYNYLIDRFGNIYEGKLGGEGVYGYHAYTEANMMGISIAMVGDFTSVVPTSAAQNSLKWLMAEKAVYHDFPQLQYSRSGLYKWLDSNYTVFGHKDSYYYEEGWIRNNTACPGNVFYEYLESITISAENIRLENFSALKTVVDQAESVPRVNKLADRVIKVVFNVPPSTSEEEILVLIPAYSGITKIEVSENIAYITVDDWDNGGFVPTVGWDGYNGAGTFFPSPNGSIDQVANLLKYFRLRGDVVSADMAIADINLYFVLFDGL